MRYVIIGAGIAGVSVAKALKKGNPSASVVIVTRERDAYYSRPLLSHGITREDIAERIVIETFKALRIEGLEIFEGTSVLSIDRRSRSMVFRSDLDLIETGMTYDVLILATGSDAALPHSWWVHRENFSTLNQLSDLLEIRRIREQVLNGARVPRWIVIGGGLIGCELAADLRKAGDTVTLFHGADRLMERQLTADQSAQLAVHFANMGIECKLSAMVTGFPTLDVGRSVVLQDGRTFEADGIIVATGFRPRIELAKAAGLKTLHGIVTDEFLKTEDPHIFSIGDVAQVNGQTYAYVLPVRSQAAWLAKYLLGQTTEPWKAPEFKAAAKIPGFPPRVTDLRVPTH